MIKNNQMRSNKCACPALRSSGIKRNVLSALSFHPPIFQNFQIRIINFFNKKIIHVETKIIKKLENIFAKSSF